MTASATGADPVPEPGVYRAHIASLEWRVATARLDLGFGIVTEPVRLTLTAPTRRGEAAVRAWLDGHDVVLVRPGAPGRGGRVPAVLVDGQAPPYVYVATTVGDVDGDTLDVSVALWSGLRYAQRVRLAGVNAPEKNTPEGAAVRAWVAQWAAGHPSVRVQTVRDRREKYGRLLATLWPARGGRSLNAELVALGMAVPYDGGRR